ncbi:MAG: sensor domain-containing protein [Geminicoccaceae bacterium]
MADNALEGILVHRMHKPLYVNRTWAELHGCTVDEVMDMLTVKGLWHECEDERLEGYVAARTAGRWAPSRYRYRARQKSGKSIWIEQFVRVINWNGEQAIQSTIFDVDAEEKQADELRQRQLSMECLLRERNEALKESNRQLHLYESIINQMSDRISIIGTDYRFRLTNQANATFRRRRPDDLIGVHVRETIGDAWFEDGVKRMLDTCFNGDVTVEERVIEAPDGGHLHIEARFEPFRDPDGTISGAIAAIRDITEAKRVEAQRRLFASVIEQASDRISVIGTDYRYRMTNKANLDYHQKPLEDFIGHHIADILGEQLFSAACKAKFDRCFAGETISSQQDGRAADGSPRRFNVLLEPYSEADGAITGAVITVRDVTEAYHLSKRLTYQARHDQLTGLINRQTFEEYLESAIDETANTSRSAAFCFIDLDQFKIVNDTVGHLVGDQLLKQVARLLQQKVREGDVLARLGGDEFGLLLKGCSLRRAERAAEKLVAVLNDNRFFHDGHVFEVGASIGITAINRHTQDIGEVMSQADLACYAAKDHGRNRVHIYKKRDTFLRRRQEEMQLAGGIRAALDQNQFTLFGQLIEDASDRAKRPERVEILLRMTGDTNDLIMPSCFIPAAERYGFMAEIDRWVINRALACLAKGGMESMDLRINVNISGATLNDNTLLDFVRGVFDETEVPVRRICFEITETAAINNLAKTEAFIGELRALGCEFALDDFGSGLSSLNYLKRLTVDYLKIDRTFIRDVRRDGSSRAMVAAIHQMAKALGIETVAEGVEDRPTLNVLRELGIDFVQGFEVGMPKPLASFS